MNTRTPAPANSLTRLAEILDLARTQNLSLIDLFKFAEERNFGKRGAEAAEIYKTWIAFNETHPYLHLVCFNYGVTLRMLGDIPGAIHAFRACLKQEPKFGPAHINLGRAFEDAGLPTMAIQQWKVLVEATNEVTPERLSHRLMALQHVGRVMENAGLLEDAEGVLLQAMELRPDKTEAGQHWSALRQRQCKWPILIPSDHVSRRQMLDSMSPLSLSNYADDPLFQLAKALKYGQMLVGRPDTRGFVRKSPKPKIGSGQPLRVGYVSSDLRDHAVGFALREVIELHDKKRVEIYAYYCGEPVDDETQLRIKKVVACWRDLAALSDADAARIIYNDDIDILIDVNGYTKHARTAIFNYRPAPVVVNFCGYPGSMGSPFHHYIIADEHVIPPESEIYYSEKVLRIPCTQPIDRKREIAATPSRAQSGLPENAFVFAGFNGSQKITEETFGRWMTILKQAPLSVLWLLSAGDDIDRRLVEAAKAAGIAPARLIFAPKVPPARHLARFALADLFLDTFPYGAHSTGADALTAGVPVLTFAGRGFAARFCHSIVHAAGLPELICSGPDDYVAKGVSYATNPSNLKKIRQKLQATRDSSVLRDVPEVARRLEDLYWQMQEESERGETPTPDLRNFDVYYEIGCEILKEGVQFTDERAYRRRYLEKLAERHDYCPIPADNRLWTHEAQSTFTDILAVKGNLLAAIEAATLQIAP